ncbi:uncharacterized protein LOC125756315 [Rhipicephalus sanguineus]|uniref:uncharacterized protein LOC125756315 n=1 Tax=Rhipicephalus sanguineus TaxID=34632 RepID=UPI0020C2C021|nr:uncharacterized protein LOC125756315 [Rhipicephalus sanguineus]
MIKKTLYVPARASNEYSVRERTCRHCRDSSCGGAQRHLPSGRGLQAPVVDRSEVRERAREGLHRVVSRRLRARGGDGGHRGLSLGRQGGRLLADCYATPVWTEARKASCRLTFAWEMFEQGARITCGEALVSARNRNKLVKTLRAILNQGRDRSLQDKPNQGKAMACVAADPANSHFMRCGRYTRFKEWRFIHRARLNLLLPLNGTRTWVPAADKRGRRCGATTPSSRLKKAALGRFTVIGENQQVGVPGLRPDLVPARVEEAPILDVCCPFDNRMQAFQEARRVKEEKYVPLQLHLLRQFERVSVEAIVVGCLGSWDPGNDRVCRSFLVASTLHKLRSLTLPPCGATLANSLEHLVRGCELLQIFRSQVHPNRRQGSAMRGLPGIPVHSELLRDSPKGNQIEKTAYRRVRLDPEPLVPVRCRVEEL